MPSVSRPLVDREDEVPSSVEPYVRVLGQEGAAKLFLSLGGSKLYISGSPRTGSSLIKTVGAEGAASLCREFGRGHVKVPVAKCWVARRLAAKGWKRAQIARLLHVTDESVRTYLRVEGAR